MNSDVSGKWEARGAPDEDRSQKLWTVANLIISFAFDLNLGMILTLKNVNR